MGKGTVQEIPFQTTSIIRVDICFVWLNFRELFGNSVLTQKESLDPPKKRGLDVYSKGLGSPVPTSDLRSHDS